MKQENYDRRVTLRDALILVVSLQEPQKYPQFSGMGINSRGKFLFLQSGCIV